MTIGEIKNEMKGKYCEIEVYEPNSRGQYYPNHFHTDNCSCTENYTDDSEVGFYELMTEEDYDNSVNANSCVETDFREWYGSEDVVVLCVMLK